jgi:hypothetical protein
VVLLLLVVVLALLLSAGAAMAAARWMQSLQSGTTGRLALRLPHCKGQHTTQPAAPRP